VNGWIGDLKMNGKNTGTCYAAVK